MQNYVLFILSVFIWTPLKLQLMAGLSDYVIFLKGAASLCHIFELGREMKKVGNHWFRIYLLAIWLPGVTYSIFKKAQPGNVFKENKTNTQRFRPVNDRTSTGHRTRLSRTNRFSKTQRCKRISAMQLRNHDEAHPDLQVKDDRKAQTVLGTNWSSRKRLQLCRPTPTTRTNQIFRILRCTPNANSYTEVNR